MEQGLFALLDACPKGMAIPLMVLTAVLSYFLGCFNGAVVVSKAALHDDVREHGSGNAGLTNFLRSYGGNLTFLVIIMDLIKVVFAVGISWWIFSLALTTPEVPAFVKFWAGTWCILGHMYPCMFHFQGGKGILCGGMLSILVDWRVAILVWGLFFVGVAVSKWVSLGSCMGAVTFSVTSLIIFPTPSICILSICVSASMIFKHRANLKRMIHGEEPKLSFHRKKAES